MLDVTLLKKGAEGTVNLSGRIDSASAAELEKALLAMVPRFDKLILNFANVPYVSSAGLRVLKLVTSQMRRKSGELTLINVRKDVMDVFRATGFAVYLDIE